MTDRVCPADRIGLTEQVIGQPDVPVRIGPADLLQCRAGARAHLIGLNSEEGADVLIALPAFKQQLKHRALFVRERHRARKPRAGAGCVTQVLSDL